MNRIIPWGAGEDNGNTNRAKVKPGLRGAATLINGVSEWTGIDNARYTVANSTGFMTWPIQQLLWCVDPNELTQGFGYDFVVRAVTGPTEVIVRGSPRIPTPAPVGRSSLATRNCISRMRPPSPPIRMKPSSSSTTSP